MIPPSNSGYLLVEAVLALLIVTVVGATALATIEKAISSASRSTTSFTKAYLESSWSPSDLQGANCTGKPNSQSEIAITCTKAGQINQAVSFIILKP